MGAFIDLTGKKFGRWTVIQLGEKWKKVVRWHCECDCGGAGLVRIGDLRTGKSQSCGCLKRAICSTVNITHGHTKTHHVTPEYRAYSGAKGRCTNPNNHKYPSYGGRGIEFRFASFEEWYAELGDKPEPKRSYSVHRIDNNGHYEHGNVKWTTASEQAAEKRKRKFFPPRSPTGGFVRGQLSFSF